MKLGIKTVLRRIFATSYRPDPTCRAFLSRAQTQDGPRARVTAAVLDADESERLFGVPLTRHGVQPVFLQILNHSDAPLRLHLISIDPNYYTPAEAADLNHFSLAKRLSAFGFIAWLIFPFLILIVPSKLITAYRANRRMNDFFRKRAFHLRPIPPGGASEGFVFTTLDLGTKIVRIRLFAMGGALDIVNPSPPARPGLDAPEMALGAAADQLAADFTFSLAVPGIHADYLRCDFQALIAPGSIIACNLSELVQRLHAMPAATGNEKETHAGDPVNLVVIGKLDMLMSAFLSRWDESETITLATCWKTARAFLFSSQYRYSPVSALYLFGRSQDLAFQRSRRSINERLHLRLWLSPLQFQGNPVWVGQVSRDIRVRFTTKAWNLTTHQIDPDVDEARDYVVEDLLQAEHVDAAGYLDGVGLCGPTAARRNLCGDPYYTDGKRAVILLSTGRAKPRVLAGT